jgi:hypothetical protein
MKLELWQKNIMTGILTGGIRSGEMTVVSAGRGVGKSVFLQPLSDRWWRGASAECDDGVWHTVICFEAIAAWVRAQDPALWMETTCPNGIGSTFDIADSLLVLLALKWSDGRA